MKFRTKKGKFNSVVISCKSQQHLSESFLRFQEYYESPFWAGKIFTIGQFKKWYSEKYGADTYKKDWSGFNFPSYVLTPFRQGLFDPLTNSEKEILNLLKYRSDEFYVIGSNTKDVLNHEFCHALYYSNKNYKNSIDNLLNKNKNKLKKAFDFILKLGYNKKVLYDEFQAYCLDGYFEENNIVIPSNVSEQIKKLRTKYEE